ncbi:MAG: rhodanese-like domain-containing protein [Campylobacterota bacterium]
MKLSKIIAALALAFSSMLASEFISYGDVASKLIQENKKNGNYATIADVKKALKADDWLVADVRTKEEWSAAHIKGTVRVGRQAPEKALENFVSDLDDNFVKKKLIVVCNSAKRASIEAQTFKQMGFENVKIFDLYSWIDECNPVTTTYSVKKDKKGTGLRFGSFYAQHCKEK